MNYASDDRIILNIHVIYFIEYISIILFFCVNHTKKKVLPDWGDDLGADSMASEIEDTFIWIW